MKSGHGCLSRMRTRCASTTSTPATRAFSVAAPPPRYRSSENFTSSAVTGSPPGDQPPEHGAVAKPVTLRQCRRALLEPRADRLAGRHVEAGHLALVPHEGGDLALDRVADVDDDVGLVGAPVPQLAHLVRAQAFARDLLGEVQVITRERIDGVAGGEAGLAMVAVLEVADAIRIVHEDRVRPVLTDGAHDVAE